MGNWVDNLISHYEAVRRKHPGEKLLIVCDIDMTILDMRRAIANTLMDFDLGGGSRYFENIGLTDVDGSEEVLQSLFDRLQLPSEVRLAAGAECARTTLSADVILSAHHRFHGMLDLIRWFQLQPHTYVAILTGRPDWSRANTLCTLRVLEEAYSVRFSDDLLYMKPSDPKQPTWEAKVNGIEHFRQAGFHVFAAIDSDSNNLRAIAEAKPEMDTVLLRSDEMVKSMEERVVGWRAKEAFQREVKLPEAAHSRSACFIWDWQETTEEAFLRFLSSGIQWIKLDARFFFPDSDQGRFKCATGKADLDFCLTLIRDQKKKLHIALPEDGLLLGRILDVISDYDFEDIGLWFSREPGSLKHHDFKLFEFLHRLYPCSILEYSLYPLVLSIQANPAAAKKTLQQLEHEGVNIFSLDWRIPNRMAVLRRLDHWGFHVNICGADSLGSFLEAALSQPSAITSAFNHCAGKGGNLSVAESGDYHLMSSLVA